MLEGLYLLGSEPFLIATAMNYRGLPVTHHGVDSGQECEHCAPARREGARVAQPFGFALTDPYVRLSRIWVFPKVTPI
jgi:hypothetical protein